MKRRLNILCVLVMLVLGYSVLESAYLMGRGFGEGLAIGMNMVKKEKGKTPDVNKLNNVYGMKAIALMPNNFTGYTDSVYNEKSATYVPAVYNQMVVIVPTKSDIWGMLVPQLFILISLFTTLLTIVLFVKLIVSINKSDTFNWKNVYTLRWIGGSLILSYFCIAIPAYIAGYQLSEVFALRGYSLHQSDLTSVTTLVLGITSLIVAEVFAIGLRLKEEQDLTI